MYYFASGFFHPHQYYLGLPMSYILMVVFLLFCAESYSISLCEYSSICVSIYQLMNYFQFHFCYCEESWGKHMHIYLGIIPRNDNLMSNFIKYYQIVSKVVVDFTFPSFMFEKFYFFFTISPLLWSVLLVLDILNMCVVMSCGFSCMKLICF